MNELRETYNFSPDFQDMILACFVRHPEKFARYGPVLKAQYFGTEHSQMTARTLLAHQGKYGNIPSWTALANGLVKAAERVGSSVTPEECAHYIERIKDVSTKDADFVADMVIEFAKERAILNAARDLIGMLQDNKAPTTSLIKPFEEALKVGENLADLGVRLHHDYAETIREACRQDFGLKTGYELLDKIWPLGWAPGWLIVPLAPPKRFKTAFCLNLAKHMANPYNGGDVLYYACEIDEVLGTVRLCCSLTGQTQEEMIKHTEVFIGKTGDALGAHLGHDILVKHYPAGSASIADIRVHARTVIKEFQLNVKAIFIDYAETVRSSSHGDKNVPAHRQQSEVYTEARALGHEFKCCVIMPDRCNKETVGRRKPSMKSFQGSFEKAGIVDVGIGICATEAEYEANILRFFVFINRHGEAHQHLLGKIDPACMQIVIDEYAPAVEGDDEEEDLDAPRPRPRRRQGRRPDPDAGLPAELR